MILRTTLSTWICCLCYEYFATFCTTFSTRIPPLSITIVAWHYTAFPARAYYRIITIARYTFHGFSEHVLIWQSKYREPASDIGGNNPGQHSRHPVIAAERIKSRAANFAHRNAIYLTIASTNYFYSCNFEKRRSEWKEWYALALEAMWTAFLWRYIRIQRLIMQ